MAERGVAPAQVAEWAGNSVAVLLRVYAKCLVGSEQTALQRIEEAEAVLAILNHHSTANSRRAPDPAGHTRTNGHPSTLKLLVRGHLPRWWQVLGSNQHRLSRR